MLFEMFYKAIKLLFSEFCAMQQLSIQSVDSEVNHRPCLSCGLKQAPDPEEDDEDPESIKTLTKGLLSSKRT